MPDGACVIEPGSWPDARTSVESERLDMVVDELVESRSECAITYFSVLISSANGWRNETCFAAGKRGSRVGNDIFR
jgi:hypothetical protein